MLKKFLFFLFFIIPSLFDVLILLVYFVPFFTDPSPLYTVFSYEVFSFGFFMTVLFFLFVALSQATSIKKPTHPLAKSIQRIALQNHSLIIISVVMTLSTILTVFILQFYGYLIPQTNDMSFFPLLFFICKLGLIIIIVSTVMFSPKHYIQLRKGFLSIFFILLVLGLTTIYTLFSQEGQPEYYATFPLDDKKAVYILNYDGDYWLTYYHITSACTQTAEGKTCKQRYEKIGNAAITESPVDLKPFVDKHVTITGDFVKIAGLLERDHKKFCLKGSCVQSLGPGQWVSSPIIIRSIKSN